MATVKAIVAAACIGITSAVFTAETAKADQNKLIACIKQYTSIGITPDAALAECNKASLAGCVQSLIGMKYEAFAIKYLEPKSIEVGAESSGGYLVDLGNLESRWLEGKQWVEKGCVAYTKGPYKRQSDKIETFWGTQRSYEWFRQGICKENKIQLDQPYSMEEAKLRCELGEVKPAEIKSPTKNDSAPKP
jgi:hypothetical protein